MASNDLQDVVEEHSPFTVCAINPKEGPQGPKLDSMVLVNGSHACRIVANGAVAAPPKYLTVSKMYRCARLGSGLYLSGCPRVSFFGGGRGKGAAGASCMGNSLICSPLFPAESLLQSLSFG
jgi:hypothetical protein